MVTNATLLHSVYIGFAHLWWTVWNGCNQSRGMPRLRHRNAGSPNTHPMARNITHVTPCQSNRIRSCQASWRSILVKLGRRLARLPSGHPDCW